MTETLQAPIDDITADMRSMELISLETQSMGAPSAKLLRAVMDEERTHATEVVVAKSIDGYAVIPRGYTQIGGSLLDEHGSDLVTVADGGLKDAENKTGRGELGAAKELERRKSERANIDTVLDMPAGSVMVETSGVPLHWTRAERMSQGYEELCQTRVTYKQSETEVVQFIIVTKSSTPDFLIERQKQLGTSEEEITTNADELLAKPAVFEYDGNAKSLITEVENQIMIASINSEEPTALATMSLRGLRRRREVWSFANNQKEIETAFLESLKNVASKDKNMWADTGNNSRVGYWTLLLEEFNREGSDSMDSEMLGEADQRVYGLALPLHAIEAAAERAAERREVFIACGGAIMAGVGVGLSPGSWSTGGSKRLSSSEIKTLLERSGTTGSCKACGKKGDLYGCGVFCAGCNKEWCNEAQRSGKHLSYEQLAKRRGRSVVKRQSEERKKLALAA